MSTMLINKKFVPRHQKTFALCHWLNAFAFFMLFLTALPLYADTFRFMYDIFGDKTLMYAHRVFGVMFIATPIIGFFIAREGYLTMIKEVFRFGKKDMEFMQKFPIELMGKDPHMPPQGFYNGGKKMNIALQPSSSPARVLCSGWATASCPRPLRHLPSPCTASRLRSALLRHSDTSILRRVSIPTLCMA